jgi:UDP-N-acetylmuramoyl-tripeptide--D-alanyl-D-alanine ligase
LKAHAQRAGVGRILTFGTRANADARLIVSEPRGDGQKITASIHGRKIECVIGAAGAHIAMNAVAALLAVQELGADLARCAEALKQFSALKGRGARVALNGIELIDESYNANPASMAAALDLLGQTRPKGNGRRIAVLGDMLELGENAPALHRGLHDAISAAGANLVFLCGPQMRALWGVLPEHVRGGYAENSAALAPQLIAALRADDVVLVKGSFGSRMSVIIDALKAHQAAMA